MKLYKVYAIFLIQLKDTLKNMQIMVLFLVYPLIAFVISNGIPGQSEMFISVFATMHAVFTPMVATVTILSEQKDKKILQSLLFANVSSREYIIANGLFVFLFTLISSLLFLIIQTSNIAVFLIAISLGSITSILVGAAIALYAKNASSANALSIPIAMVFSFLPMLAVFNTGIKRYSDLIYSQQVSSMIALNAIPGLKGLCIILLNMGLFFFLFMVIYHKSRKESS